MPTAEAELLYPRAIAVLDELQNLEEDISRSKSSVSGELVIKASTIPGTYLLPIQAAAFKQKYPDTSFEIGITDTANVIDDIVNNKVHLGFVGARKKDAKLTFRPMAEDELILVSSGRRNINPEISLADLSGLPFLIREKGSGTRKSMETLLAQEQFSVKSLNISATLGSSAAIKEAVKADLGVSIMSQLAVQDELQRGDIKQISLENLQLKRHFYAVTSTRRTLPYHYQLFIDHLFKEK